MDKNCGTCKWWSLNDNLARRTKQVIGDCNWSFDFPEVLPESTYYSGFITECMLEEDGQDCPVWEKKE